MNERPPRGFDLTALEPTPWVEPGGPVTALALDLAGRCNLACRYCAESATQPRRPGMDPAVLDAAWRFLVRSRPGPGCSIRLGSGEPLLARPLLQRLQERITRDGRWCPAVFLTTNGTLIDPATADWLVASGWQVKVSLDGPARVHDRWRVARDGRGTFRRVARAVRELARRIPGRLSVTAVLCRDGDPAAALRAIARLGVRRLELVPAAHHDPGIRPGPGDVRRYRAFLADYARRFLPGGRRPVIKLVRFTAAVRRALGYDLSRIQCGAGRNFVAAGPDGRLYPCFRFVGIESFVLGDVMQGIDLERAGRFRRGAGRAYQLRTACRKCWAAPLCGGPCFAVTETFGPGGHEPDEMQCRYRQADARAAVELVTRLRRVDPRRLLDFLPLPMSAGKPESSLPAAMASCA